MVSRGTRVFSEGLPCVATALLLTIACLALPDRAWATVEGDQTPLGEDEIAAALASGEIEVEAEGGEGVSAASVFAAPAAFSDGFFNCFSGADRYEVAVMEAKAAYRSSDRAVIAGGEGWADALGAAGLAGVWDCPILLTDGGSLTDCTRQALKDLGVSSVTIVGGPNTVSPDVEGAIKEMGISVDRIGGADRYEVQINIYNRERAAWNNDMAIIASGVNFPDALSISPVSFKDKVPIFLVDENGALNDVQKTALGNVASAGGFSQIIIAGGPNSVSTSTEAFAESLTAAASGGTLGVTRLGGADRFEASANIAEWSVEKGGLSWSDPAIAMGSKPYDALCGSILQGKTGSVLMVVDPDNANEEVYGLLENNKSAVSSVRVFGGKESVPMTIRMDIADIFDIPYCEIPDLKVYVDAGHGQNDSNNGVFDPGACSGGYREADLTASLAKKVNAILNEKYGVDTFLNVDGGWYKLRAAEAKANGCDLIVSIHFNSGGGTGTETLIHSYNEEPRSWDLQDAVHPRLIEGTTLHDRGQKRQEVAILGGGLPATLLEIAFIDNGGDMGTYFDREDIIAEKIAEGIVG